MGIESYATVKALAPSFVDTRLWDEARNGDFVKRPIIGKFEHQVGGYLRLRFDNDTTTVGVTGTHPFWSEDRHTWVKAQNLNIGENLKTQFGTAILTQRQTLETKTTVYNLEVYQDHNYLVSEDRLLVHNDCSAGRSGKQDRLKELAEDDKLGSADRGWIQQEINSIERGSERLAKDGVTLKPQKNIRNPPGKQLAHRRGKEARKGYGYEHSDLQDTDLHQLQHKHEGYK